MTKIKTDKKLTQMKSIRMPDEMIAAIDKIAGVTGRKASSIILNAISEHLERNIDAYMQEGARRVESLRAELSSK
jgi:predicted DNA-binding protein